MGGRGSVVADCLLSERRASGCLIRAVNSLTSAEASQRCGGLSRGRQPLHGSPHGDFRTDARRRWTRVQATDPVRSRGGRGRAWELWGSAAVAVGLHVASGDVCVRVDGGCRAPRRAPRRAPAASGQAPIDHRGQPAKCHEPDRAAKRPAPDCRQAQLAIALGAGRLLPRRAIQPSSREAGPP